MNDENIESTESSQSQTTDARDFQSEARVLSDIIAAFYALSERSREHVLRTVATFFGLTEFAIRGDRARISAAVPTGEASAAIAPFSEDRRPTPKQFLLEKRPQTDVERITCLAYYLTHYRDMPHFKTLDLSQLNTEAAQIKFSNPTKAVTNSIRAGFIVTGPQMTKQIASLGEMYVQALPDRDAARAAIADGRRRRRPRRAAKAVTGKQEQ